MKMMPTGHCNCPHQIVVNSLIPARNLPYIPPKTVYLFSLGWLQLN